MVTLILGFLLALVSAVAFGLYVLPRRESRLGPEAYLFYMAVGFLIPSVLMMAFLHGLGHETLPTGANLAYVVLSGVIWALANLSYILAIDAAGVARATAVKNLTGLFGTLAGIVLLGELLHAASILMTLVGSAAVAASAILLGRLSAPESVSGAAEDGAGALAADEGGDGETGGAHHGATATGGSAPAAGRLLGMVLALLAAVGLGVYLVPGLVAMKRGVTTEMYVASFAFVAGIATIVMVMVWAWMRASRLRAGFREALLPGIAGVLWIGGSAAVTPATTLTGLAIAWPVSQLGFFLTLAYAIIRFREVDWARGRRSVMIASGLTLVGLVLLGVARGGG